MKAFLRSVLPAIAALAVIGSAAAAEQPRKQLNLTTTVEKMASEVVLPSTSNGTLLMKECAQCALKSYPVTASTAYYVSGKPAALTELSTSVAGQPKAYVGVTYSRKTGEIVAVRAVPTRVGQPK